VGIDRVLLEAMGVHARAAAVTGQLAVSKFAVSELAMSEEDCCDYCPSGRMGRCGMTSSSGGPGLTSAMRPGSDSSAG
jgi:hypothetical protein